MFLKIKYRSDITFETKKSNNVIEIMEIESNQLYYETQTQ